MPYSVILMVLSLNLFAKAESSFRGASCNESSVSVADVTAIANSPKVTNTVDFLKALPADSFQSYTFVTNSQSGQKGSGDSAVSPNWPRVLRTNKDGTITFSWTCNPNSETNNKIEMLYYEKGELKAKSFNLNSAPDSIGLDGRVNNQPTSCVSCHSTGIPINGKLSMKHNWPSYFVWSDCKEHRGIQVYGGNDDNMGYASFTSRFNSFTQVAGDGCTEVDDRKTHDKEKKDYANFKEIQKDNPCYNLLPHPKDKKDILVQGRDYSYYPYSNDSRDVMNDREQFDYSIRTNLRFTDEYGHVNALRITNLVEKGKDYDQIKYYLAMESANCLDDSDKDALRKNFPNVNQSEKPANNFYKQGDPREEYPLLYGYSRFVGLQPADWSLEFKTNTNYQDPSYTPGIASQDGYSRDLYIPDIVGGDILRDLAKEDPDIAKVTKDAFGAGITKAFGKNFSCIDDLGEAIVASAKGAGRPLCNVLREKNDKQMKAYLQLKANCDITTNPTSVGQQAKSVLSSVDQIKEEFQKQKNDALLASVARGKSLVQDHGGAAHCIECHGRSSENIATIPQDLLFIPSDSVNLKERNLSSQVLKHGVNEGLFDTIKENVNDGTMPADGKLTPSERTDVLNYIKSLVSE